MCTVCNGIRLANLPACTHEYTSTNTITQSGETALHCAVNQEHEDIVDLLLKANADKDLPMKVIYAYHTQQSCDLNEV